ncbi:MAG: hypothetical protein ACRC2H_02365 [Silanimonas sp.]
MKKLLFALAVTAALTACGKTEEAAPATDAAPADAAAPATDAAPADTTAPATDAAAPAADAAAPATDAMAPATDAAAPATDAAATASLPKECEDYLARAQACFDKAGAGGAAMRAGFDQTRAAWDALDATSKAALGPACTQANDAFNQTAQALGC